VDAIIGAGTVRILEQNAEPALKKVQQYVLHTADINSTGTTHKHVKNPESGRLQAANVIESTTVSVSGTVVAYRPRHR
jgi:hypothetical protein